MASLWRGHRNDLRAESGCLRSKCGPQGSWGPSFHAPSVDRRVRETRLTSAPTRGPQGLVGPGHCVQRWGAWSLASSSGRGQVSFLSPDSKIICPFSEKRSGCSAVVCHFPEPLFPLIYPSGGKNSSPSRRAGGRHSICWKDFSAVTLYLPSLQPGLSTSRRQVTVSP